VKKKIVILGSTGSIGKSLLRIISKNSSNIKIVLLSANKSSKILLSQAKKFNVKNLIITDKNSYQKCKSMNLKKINLYNNFEILDKIFPKKIDYTMSAIIGLDGLYPTLKMIKFSKKIAIANKESLVCAWNLIKKELDKFKTKFIPVDSEHFSIWFSLNDELKNKIEKIYITASGGPFLNRPINKFQNISLSESLKHPNWKMGKKITIDSSTLMNKVFEVIEARNIFDISLEKINVLIHPKSYIHSIIKFNNGMLKIIAHDTTMDIPIFNSLYDSEIVNFKSKPLNILNLNSLMIANVNKKKFPLINLIKKMSNNQSLYETVIVSANDELVKNYLLGKIKFNEISKKLFKFLYKEEFAKYKRIVPKNINDIIMLSNYVRSKINTNFVKSK